MHIYLCVWSVSVLLCTFFFFLFFSCYSCGKVFYFHCFMFLPMLKIVRWWKNKLRDSVCIYMQLIQAISMQHTGKKKMVEGRKKSCRNAAFFSFAKSHNFKFGRFIHTRNCFITHMFLAFKLHISCIVYGITFVQLYVLLSLSFSLSPFLSFPIEIVTKLLLLYIIFEKKRETERVLLITAHAISLLTFFSSFLFILIRLSISFSKLQ